MTVNGEQRAKIITWTTLRVAAGVTYFSHATMKLFGWFGGVGPEGGPADLMTRWGAAGVIETVASVAIILGLFTRPLALIASGEMAVAYFWIHWAGESNHLWWWTNRGELVMLYSFVWLLFAAWGAGPYSLDAWLARRKAETH